MTLADLYPGARVAISGPGINVSGRVTNIVHVDRPASIVVHVWSDAGVGSSVTIPSGMERLVTIEDIS